MKYKIDSKFHHFRQAEMDELISIFLSEEAQKMNCDILDLSSEIGFKTLNYMIDIFAKEVETIWQEQKFGRKIIK